MPNLVNMKMDRKELEEKYSSTPAEMDMPAYPYGLRVNLDEDAIDKLGLNKLPSPGKTMLLLARVDIVSVSDNENVQGGKTHRHRSVELQITDLALDKDSGDAATTLYDGNKAQR